METMPMNRDEFLLEMDEILDLPAGTLRGHEKLEELQNWDSTSLITLLPWPKATTAFDLSWPNRDLLTVADLLRLARAESGCLLTASRGTA